MARRIVSLIASSTEILCALGFERELVGRSHECDFPPSVGRLPVCTSPRFDVGGSSGEVDRAVKEALREALSVYLVDADLLRSLHPTHVVTQAQCEVCAVSLKDVERALGEWLGRAGEGSAPEVISLSPADLKDVWSSFGQVAAGLGDPQRALPVVERLRARMEAVEGRARALGERPTVAAVEWIDPLMAAGNWMPELLEMAGGRSLFGEAGRHSPNLRWEDLREADPEVIVVTPCGYELGKTREEMSSLAARPGWSRLRAVRGGRVYIADGSRYFNRPGPRLVESLEILAEALHPRAFHFTHRGTAWEEYRG